MELVLAKSQDAIVLTSISKRAFNSDIGVGGTQAGGPPGYQSHKFYMKNIQSHKKRYISRPERMSLSTGPFLHTLQEGRKPGTFVRPSKRIIIEESFTTATIACTAMLILVTMVFSTGMFLFVMGAMYIWIVIQFLCQIGIYGFVCRPGYAAV